MKYLDDVKDIAAQSPLSLSGAVQKSNFTHNKANWREAHPQKVKLSLIFLGMVLLLVSPVQRMVQYSFDGWSDWLVLIAGILSLLLIYALWTLFDVRKKLGVAYSNLLTVGAMLIGGCVFASMAFFLKMYVNELAMVVVFSLAAIMLLQQSEDN